MEMFLDLQWWIFATNPSSVVILSWCCFRAEGFQNDPSRFSGPTRHVVKETKMLSGFFHFSLWHKQRRGRTLTFASAGQESSLTSCIQKSKHLSFNVLYFVNFFYLLPEKQWRTEKCVYMLQVNLFWPEGPEGGSEAPGSARKHAESSELNLTAESQSEQAEVHRDARRFRWFSGSSQDVQRRRWSIFRQGGSAEQHLKPGLCT